MKGKYFDADVEVKTFFETRMGWIKEIPTSVEQWKDVVKNIAPLRKYRVPASIQLTPIEWQNDKELAAKEPPVFTGEIAKIEVIVTYKE